MQMKSVCALAVLLIAATGCSVEPADLVLRGGKVVTVDASLPEAQAIAVRGYEIVAVGSDARIERYIGPDTEIVELNGRLAIPGFIDGHGHYMSVGNAKMILDLTTARTWADIVALVAEAARSAEPGAWIDGRGWHQEKWDEVPQPNVDGVPYNTALNRVAPDNPVNLTHASGHASIANAMALRLAGIGRDTPDPDGGTIVRDRRGTATGLLRETAQRLVGAAQSLAEEKMTAGEREERARTEIMLAGQEALSKGVTSFHDAGVNFATIDRYRAMADAGELPIRINAMVRRETNEEMERRLDDYLMIPEGNDFLTVRCIKRQIDGAMGSHGAWLLEPYSDLPSTAGLNLEPVEDIRRTCEIAIQHGFQVATHAIGDRGNREVLDIYEAVFRANPGRTDLRWRIEHSQHVDPADVDRFRDLGVIASMQTNHCTSDGPWVLQRLGEERAEATSYLWRTFLDKGIVVTNGTDCPVEDIDPIANFYSAVSRRCFDGSLFFPEQKMTREEALYSYTMANAYAAFEEDLKGSITPGKLADIVVLSHDIMTVPEEQITEAKVDFTILGGEIRHARTGADRN